jgi:hypothetical protein
MGRYITPRKRRHLKDGKPVLLIVNGALLPRVNRDELVQPNSEFQEVVGLLAPSPKA